MTLILLIGTFHIPVSPKSIYKDILNRFRNRFHKLAMKACYAEYMHLKPQRTITFKHVIYNNTEQIHYEYDKKNYVHIYNTSMTYLCKKKKWHTKQCYNICTCYHHDPFSRLMNDLGS